MTRLATWAWSLRETRPGFATDTSRRISTQDAVLSVANVLNVFIPPYWSSYSDTRRACPDASWHSSPKWTEYNKTTLLPTTGCKFTMWWCLTLSHASRTQMVMSRTTLAAIKPRTSPRVSLYKVIRDGEREQF